MGTLGFTLLPRIDQFTQLPENNLKVIDSYTDPAIGVDR